MKKFLLLFGFSGISFLSYSQLTVDNTTLTPAQLVQQVLAGSGVTVTNVTFNGVPANTVNIQVGSFNGSASNIGLNAGVIMGSGNVQLAPGPNNNCCASMGLSGQQGTDPDLQAITPNQIYDQAILEFDFVPEGDTVSFRYVFGSEEYDEYVCGSVNDAFGFFISGPGIVGPYTNNAKNIALIPGTTTGVSINTVNLGVPGTNGQAVNCNSIDPNWPSYNVFYNGTNTQQTVQYDGWTVVLTASSAVQCGQQYHIKLAISDAGDGAWDSGVFLEASSFSSESVDVELTTLFGSDTIVEGCPNGAIFSFMRTNTSSADTLNYLIGGNATNGVDYTPISGSIFFPVGVDSVTLSITALVDGIPESNLDSLVITLYIVNGCGDTVSQTATLYIVDMILVQANAGPDQTINCPGELINLGGSAPGDIGQFFYNWSTGHTTDTVFNYTTLTSQWVYLTVSDGCLQTATDSAYITAIIPSPLIVEAFDGIVCKKSNGSVQISVVASGGGGEYQYSWTSPTSSVISVDGNTGDAIVYNPETGIYIAHVIDACGAMNSDTATVTVEPCALIIPNVISPNGDGSNDFFHVFNLELHPNSMVAIFNRWGQELYNSADYKNDWAGEGLPDGIYYYTITLTDNTSPANYHGFFHLFRTK